MGVFSEMDMDLRTAQDADATDTEEPETMAEAEEPADPPDPPKEPETPPVTEDAEAIRRREHEESEARRRAEWEAERQAREEAELFAWESALALDDDALVAASMKRVGDDSERLTRRNLKQCVTEMVQTYCLADMEFARQVMHPRKSIINCFRYITRKAKEYILQEMKDEGIEPTREGYGSDVPDDLCYQWAREYFYDMKAPEDGVEEEEFVPKPYNGRTTAQPKKKQAKTPTAPKKPEPPKPEPQKPDPKKEAPKSNAPSGQLDLFSLLDGGDVA